MFKILIGLLENTKVLEISGPILQFLNPKDIVNLQRVSGGGIFRQTLKERQKNLNVMDQYSVTNENLDKLMTAPKY